MTPEYVVQTVGYCLLPDELSTATDDDVEDVLRRAADLLGHSAVEIERVRSVLGASCITCIDVVATVGGDPVVVARPRIG